MNFRFFTLGLSLLLFMANSRYLEAQVSISGIVNSYTPVTAITQPACAACDVACIHTITVGNAAAFSVGDKALIIQMKGATINTANAAGSGNVTAINNAGNYEFFEIGSIVGNVLTPRYPLIRSYTISGVVQVVRIPEYSDVNISAPLTGLDWDETAGIGGVVAIDARKVTFNANIEMSGRGYQGIQMPLNGTPDNCSVNPNTQFVLPSTNNSSYIKGDGIVIDDNNTNRGRSPRANGGGSGVSGDSGGGGGSNYGAGGEGAKRWCDVSGANAGGIGGFSLTPFLAQDKVFLGGAGGPGWVSTGNPSTAADGGGIVIIFADTIIGNGFIINNDGLSPVAVNPVGNPDGGGGGGAGGTVVLKTNTYIGNLTVNARGGQGQDLNTTIYHGPGGGGGGGVLLYSLATLPVNVSLNVTAGLGGQHNDGFRNDSQDGQIGGNISLYIPIQNPNYEGNVDTDLISTACDVDDDNDGITDMQEVYVGDHDGDGVPDFRDPQFCAAVFQGVNGWNCATNRLPDPSGDMDGDGRPNFKDPDFPYCGGLNANGTCIRMDSDGDGSPNHLDLDSDNDGITDIVEAGGTDTNGDGFADSNTDVDGDGLVDAFDNNDTDGPTGTSACSVLPTCLQIASTSTLLDTNNDGVVDRFPDNDNDGIPNYLDLDSDNDGIADIVEAGGTDTNGDGRADGFKDLDGDGYNDILDASWEVCNITYTNTTITGNSVSVTTNTGITNPNNAVGAVNGTVAQLHDNTDVLGLDFGQTIPAGAVVTIHWRARTAGNSADLGVRISSVNPGAYTNQTPTPLSTASTTIGTSNVTTTIASRFIEIFDAGADDFQVDAVTWRFVQVTKNEICVTTVGTPLIITGADTNGDGRPNSYPSNDNDGDGILNQLDLDSDNDGIADVVEAGGTDANGDGRADNFVDADRDGFNDVVDGDPTNVLAVGSDIAGTNTADVLLLTGTDTNGDGKPNSYPTDDNDRDGILNFLDLDADNDGIADVVEVGGTDTNGDGRADNFTDADNDGFNDVVDGDPTNALAVGSDIAGTNTVDALVLTGADTNGDGRPNSYPSDDNDKDGILSFLDLDADNDGIADVVEAGGTDANGDGRADNFADVDRDGYNDVVDGDPTNALVVGSDIAGANTTDALVLTGADTNGDGRPNSYPSDNNDNDGILNFLDLDADNDGIADVVEAGGTDANGDGRADNFVDTDFDGYNDVVDGDPTNVLAVGSDVAAANTGDALVLTGADTNGDGRPNSYPTDDNDRDGILNFLDLDADNDGIADVVEAGGTDANGDGRADNFVDTDFDGFNDVVDGDPTNALIVGSDIAGANITDVLVRTGTDTNGDGRPNSYPTDDNDGDRVLNFLDLDADNDGIADVVEVGGTDANGDGRADNFADVDFDGFNDVVDGDPTNALAVGSDIAGTNTVDVLVLTGADTNGDGAPNSYIKGNMDNDNLLNFLDIDADNDGIVDILEVGGTDANGDGLVDGFSDTDGDGWSQNVDGDINNDATIDNLAGVLILTSTDTNGDGKPETYPQDNQDTDILPNFLDIDADNDGIVDNTEAQLTANYIAPANTDSDNDGLDDAYELPAQIGVFGGQGILAVNTDGLDNRDYLDTDTDNDGVLDIVEGHDTNNDGVINGADSPNANIGIGGAIDADRDGLLDGFDNNTASTNATNTNLNPNSHPNADNVATNERDWREAKDNDQDGIPNNIDLDDDNDGITDLVESNGSDPLADADGDGILNYLDPSFPSYVDSNGDGINDNFDADEDGIINSFDRDSDNDGIADVVEAGGTDTNGDGVLDGFVDVDNDGLSSLVDLNNGGSPLSNPDTDNDGVPNYLDLDSDNDGIADVVEVGGTDTNGDGRADNFVDTDKDGFNDIVDGDPTNALVVGSDAAGANTDDALILTGADTNGDGRPDSYLSGDNDRDGILNFLDLDADNDGIADVVEVGGTDANGDGRADNFADVDFDGFNDVVDGDPTNALAVGSDIAGTNTVDALVLTGSDTNGDGAPNSYIKGNMDNDNLLNFLDIDADNDGIVDILEVGGTDANGDGLVDGFSDTDGDGWSQNVDGDINNDATIDNLAGVLILTSTDTNGDGKPESYPQDNQDTDILPNFLDIDADNDGIVDNTEAQLTANYIAPANVDSDGDGLDDAYELPAQIGVFGGQGILAVNTDGLDNRDYLDTDTDNDGILDIVEGHDTNNDGIINGADSPNANTGIGGALDVDRDGLLDGFDNNTASTNATNTNLNPNNHPNADNVATNERDWREAKDNDQDGIPNNIDLDDDNDGITDLVESNGSDPLADADGDGILNYLDPSFPSYVDSNGDGINDNFDADEDGVINSFDRDSDNDGIADVVEAGGTDTNGDGVLDGFVDADNDGLSSLVDLNNGGSPLSNPDTDNDGVPNYLDLDSDNDGIADVVEAGGTDTNGDGRADNFVDTDKDGFNDVVDGDPTNALVVGSDAAGANTDDALVLTGADTNGDGRPNSYPTDDNDRDGILNFLDLDADNDGIADVVEAGGTDANGDGRADNFADVDKDGFNDIVDGDPINALAVGSDIAGANITDVLVRTGTDTNGDGRPNSYQTDDNDGDRVLNFLDLDADNDGIADVVEVGGTDANGDGRADNFADADNDGFNDVVDGDPINALAVGSDIAGANTADALVLTGADTNGDGAPNSYIKGNMDNDNLLNFLDIDADNDGIVDILEVGGTDANGDGLVDGFSDTDGDGWSQNVDGDINNDATIDNLAGVLILTSTDTNGDGKPESYPQDNQDTDILPNFLDIDADNDGIVDNTEAQLTANYIAPANVDSDGDGLDDAYELPAQIGVFGGQGILAVNTDGLDNRDYLDTDTDNDGILDIVEGHDTNNDGIINGADSPNANTGIGGALDADRDGLLDGFDNNTASTNATNTNLNPNNHPNADNTATNERDWREAKDNDRDGIPNNIDLDDDNDGITDLVESNGSDPLADADGDGILNYLAPSFPAYVDSNGDGINDNFDADEDGVINSFDRDSDNDGIADVVEAGGTDTNGDGVLDGFVDVDNDGLSSLVDLNNGGSPLSNPDTDNDGVPNYLDLDSDNDGIADVVEAGGTDTNGDGRADNFVDTDKDGFNDVVDGDPTNALVVGSDAAGANTDDVLILTGADNNGDGSPDSYLSDDNDRDGILNFLDLDADNDGIADVVEAGGTDANGDGRADNFADADRDGFNDVVDGDPTNALAVGSDIAGANITDVLVRTGTDTNGDGRPNSYQTDDNDGDRVLNFLDLDADNDGIADVVEVGGTDANGDGRADNFADADNDGFNDVVDGDPINALAVGSDIAGTNTVDALVLTGADTNGDGAPNSYIKGNMDNDNLLNFLDIDADNDGIVDILEVGGTDANGDGLVDGFSDTDGDGWSQNVDGDINNDATIDNLAGVLILTSTDTNGDGKPESYPQDNQDTDILPNFLDIDADNDGIVDNTEAQLTANYIAPANVDSDGDGLDDAYELPAQIGVFGGQGILAVNTDGLDNRDYLDTDTDNDGILDVVEGHDTNNDGIINGADSPNANTGIGGALDVDRDGLLDGFDNNTASTNATNTNLNPNNHPNADNVATNERDWREAKDNDQDGIPNNIDLDDDNDGITDLVESNGSDPLADADGDGILNYLDPSFPSYVDSNGDGINDNFDADEDGVINSFDRDSDNDGIADVVEAGGTDTNGDGVLDGFVDADNDGLSSLVDLNNGGSPLSNPDTDNDGVPNYLDLDSDNDGIADVVEAGGTDTNGDGRADNFVDTDKDGFNDVVDGDPTNALVVGSDAAGANTDDVLILTGADNNGDGSPDSYLSGDFDGDGLLNTIDLDADNDGVADVAETGGKDTDNNGIADNYSDTDGDGFNDDVDGDVGNDGIAENTTNVQVITGADTNNDGTPNSYPVADDADRDKHLNFLDLDSDNDGITDVVENNSGAITGAATSDNPNGLGTLDGFIGNTNITDANNNGWHDASEGAVFVDSDNDGIADIYDIDADNDGIADYVEATCSACPTFSINYPTGTDTNENGILDQFENVTDANGVAGPNFGLTPNNDDTADKPDYLDLDTDNDTGMDWAEGFDNGFGTATAGDANAAQEIVQMAAFYAAQYELIFGSVCGCYPNIDADGDGLPVWLDSDDNLIGYDPLVRPLFLNPTSIYWVDEDNDGLADIFDEFINTTPVGSFSEVPDADAIDDRDWRDTRVPVTFPIELLTFEAVRINPNDVKLSWVTASEITNEGFDIERMLDNETEFQKVGFEPSTRLTNVVNYYNYIDRNPYPGVSYYRLRQIDADGNATYSPVRAVYGENIEQKDPASIFPNPADDVLNVRFGQLPEASNAITIRVIDATGKVLQSQKISVASYEIINLNLVDYAPATYAIHILYADGSNQIVKFIRE